MSPGDRKKRAVVALDSAETALAKLDALCCDPGRSPRMAALDQTLSKVRVMLDTVGDDPETADVVLSELENAGSQIGSLQVTCCAPARMPLYAEMLTALTKVQLSVKKSVGRTH